METLSITRGTYLHFLLLLMLISIVVFVYTLAISEGAAQRPVIEAGSDQTFIDRVIGGSSVFTEKYVPTMLWGRSGHFQTVLHAAFGRIGTEDPLTSSQRVHLDAPDGSRVTYDLFEPEKSKLKSSSADMILVVPGIGNHAETCYIRAYSHYMTRHGFRVAVYNHTGALQDEELKKPKIFSFGHTEDLALAVSHLLATERIKKVIGVGFSLGGNLLMKYLGERPERQDHFHLCVSVCQGYDALKAYELFLQWGGLRRAYNLGLCNNYKKVILSHKESLIKMGADNINWDRISFSTSMHELDELFTKKIHGIADLQEYYWWSSSKNYIHNIRIPALAVNALDDPLVPEELLEAPRRLIKNNPRAMFVTMEYGGHLGFYEGGYVIPDSVSWIDRLLLGYISSALNVIRSEEA